MTTYKKSDYEQKSEGFKNLPDGKYETVLDSVKLDMTNKYGPRISLVFKHVNNRLSWADIRENKNSKKGPLAMAWFTLSKLDAGTSTKEMLPEEYDYTAFLNAALHALEARVGNYYEIELVTTTSATTNKEYQNTRVLGLSDGDRFASFKMPKADTTKAPGLDNEETIPF
jgi:hypothetical protein